MHEVHVACPCCKNKRLFDADPEETIGIIKITKVNGGRTRNLPKHDKEKWDAFVKYNIRDVEVELSIQGRLSKFPVPDFVWEEFWLDQEINSQNDSETADSTYTGAKTFCRRT